MARRIVWLKWRLLANGLKADRQRAIGLPLLIAALVAGAWTLAKRYHAAALDMGPQAAGELSIWVAVLAWATWTTVPVLLLPVDETLDPAKFGAAPLTRIQLMSGLGGAGFITPPIIAPVILLGVNLLLFRGPAVTPVAVAGFFLLLLHLVIGGQAFTTAVSALVKSRRGRDLTMVLIAGLAVGVFALQQAISRSVGALGLAQAAETHSLSSWAWLIPPAGAQAAVVAADQGRWGQSILFFALSSLLLIAVAWLWHRLLTYLTTNPPSSGPAGKARFRSFADLPGWSAVFVIARKEFRYYLRDPRMRMVWTGAVIFLAVTVASLIAGTARIEAFRDLPSLVLATPTVVLFIGLPIALNQLGWERRSASYLFALPTGRRAVLVGKNLAVASGLVIETMVLATVFSWATGGWRFLGWMVPLMLTAILTQLAVGNVASVLTPLRLPDMGTDVFSQASEQGCLAIIAQIVAFSLIGLLLVPVALGWVLALTDGGPQWLNAVTPLTISIASVVWGGALYLTGLEVASRVLWRRTPEIVSWVQVV